MNLRNAISTLQKRLNKTPALAIITGTGLSAAPFDAEIHDQIPYQDIPGLLPGQLEGHEYRISEATLHNTPLIIFSGRFHHYEGVDPHQIAMPVRLAKKLGVDGIIMTNVAGALDPSFDRGDFVAISDHINFIPVNPLRGEHQPEFGPRFIDMSNAYTQEWRDTVQRAGMETGEEIKEGVYACMSGPSLETPAEYAFLAKCGAQLVGMSTVPEVLAAHQMGLKILAVSLVTNECHPPSRIKKTTIEDVLEVAHNRQDELQKLLSRFIRLLSSNDLHGEQ